MKLEREGKNKMTSCVLVQQHKDDGRIPARAKRALVSKFHLCCALFGSSSSPFTDDTVNGNPWTMFRFGSKRDLRADSYKCTIRLLNENEVLDEVEFKVSKHFGGLHNYKCTSSLYYCFSSGKRKVRICWIEYLLT